jgi:DNA-binding response OmpR family regulator
VGEDSIGFLAKPFEPDELTRRVRDVLDTPE